MTTLLAVFAGVALLVGSLWIFGAWWLGRRQARLARTLGRDSEPTLLLDDRYDGRGGDWWAQLRRWSAERMERTGLELTAFEGLAAIFICGAVLAALVFFWRYEEEESWMAVPAFLIGIAFPLAYFILRQRQWRLRLQDQLPDMLFLMARSLRAGLSIDQAIAVMGEHGVAPASKEFARMHRQLDLGLALHQVLRGAANRIRLVDFSVFASVLSLHRSTGGNLAVLMDRLAQTTRDHNQLRGYYRSATSLGRYAGGFLIVGSILLIGYLMMFQREMAARYFDSPAGLTMFAIGAGLMALGILVFFYMIRREDV
jgi:tight adherence protein B